jgi:hypothetical protein
VYFLLSGEGPSDMGACADGSDGCEGDAFVHGPMAMFVDRLVQARHGYSPLEARCCGFVPERVLGRRASELKAARKGLRLPGKKREKETRYFFNNARLLARIAREKAMVKQDDIVAVLFRDSDGTASAGRGAWEERFRSMIDGFAEEGFDRGVPMLPKPKSEAWLLCALKEGPYQACEDLEDRSGNDDSPHSLKRELRGILGEEILVIESLRAMIEDGTIDPVRIEMPSFERFRSRLKEVI